MSKTTGFGTRVYIDGLEISDAVFNVDLHLSPKDVRTADVRLEIERVTTDTEGRLRVYLRG